MTDTTDGEAFRRAADERLQQAYDSPMSLDAYVDRVLANPIAAASGPRYLLAAIESQGTRTVEERGAWVDALVDRGYSEDGAAEVLEYAGAAVARSEMEDGAD